MRLIIVLLTLLLSTCINAQYTYETYTPANGLVDARVSGMIQDRYGRLIIYTREGFSIYDGQRFKNYLTIDNEEIGIITGSLVLPDSSLYLVRFTGSPVKIEKDRISYDHALLKNVTEVSTVNKSSENTSLIMTNLGAYLLRNRNLKKLVNKSSAYPLELKNTVFGTAYKDKILLYLNDGNLLQSLVLFDSIKNEIVDQIDNIAVSNIIKDKQGNIYFYNQTNMYALDLLSLTNNTIKFGRSSLFAKQGFKTKGFLLDFDNQNNAWLLNTTSDCYRSDPKTGDIKTFNSTTGLLKGVSGLYQDKENNYWFLIHGKGIQKLVQTNYEEVRTIHSKEHIQKKFIYNLPDQSVFIDGINGRYSMESATTIALPATTISPDIPLIFWQNTYWFFKDKYTLQNGENTSIRFNLPPDDILLAVSPKIKTDQNGNLLIGGNIFYLLTKDGQAAAATLPYYTDNISTDVEGNYWAFCRGTSKAIKFRFTGGKLVTLKEYQFPLTAPRCALYWDRDIFLIGTRNNGLVFVKVTATDITTVASISRKNGLSNNFVLDIVRINESEIGVATAAGVNILHISNTDTSIQNISSSIDIYDPVSNLVADRSGNLYAVSETTNALYRYTGSPATNPAYSPVAYISDITVNKEKIIPGRHQFEYNENNFVIDIAAPSFIDNRNIVFHFLLKGKDEIETFNNTGTIELNNLEPGSFDLFINIVYPGNIYPEQKLHYAFKIKQPFWQTGWFIAGLLVAVFLISWVVIRFRYRQKLQKTKIILEKELAIEQERSRMARELHDGLGSMLSGVKHSFSAMESQLDMDQTHHTIFHANIEKLNDTIRELRNISHSMASESLLQYGLENSLHDYCQHLNLTNTLKISFSALNMDQAPVNEEQAFHIFRIVQELLTNITKHAAARSAILQLSYNENRIYITVEDDGQGFDLTDIKNNDGLGLKNIESRVKILKGRIDYRSEPAKGTSVFIEIPVKH